MIDKMEKNKATFAGGCFWCMEYAFRNLKKKVILKVGYANCKKENPTYEEVSKEKTGCYEAIQITYPDDVKYEELLDIFWHNINPEDKYGQFSDRGEQYRTAIFWHTEEQRKKALASKKALMDKGIFKKIETKILKFRNFYEAESYHQSYYEKNPVHFFIYEKASGREAFLNKIWGKNREKE